MTDQELLQAIGQVVEAKIDPMRQDIHTIKNDVRTLQENYAKLEKQVGGLEKTVEGLSEKVSSLDEKVGSLDEKVSALEKRVGGLEEKVTGIRVYIDTDLNRTLNLLLEGQKAVWDRATPPEQYDALEVRTSALEVAVRQHSREIEELMLA